MPCSTIDMPVSSAGGNRPYPWDTTPQSDLAEARQLIEHHGYLRRLPELEDAEAALTGLPEFGPRAVAP